MLVLTPDDWMSSRDVAAFGPRDNVIFELGLFMGHLGRSRTSIRHAIRALGLSEAKTAHAVCKEFLEFRGMEFGEECRLDRQ